MGFRVLGFELRVSGGFGVRARVCGFVIGLRSSIADLRIVCFFAFRGYETSKAL